MRRVLIVLMVLLAGVGLSSSQTYLATMSLSMTTVDTGAGPPVAVLIVDLWLQTTSGTGAALGTSTFAVTFNSACLGQGYINAEVGGYWWGGSYDATPFSAFFTSSGSVRIKYNSGPGLAIPSTPARIAQLGFVLKDPTEPAQLNWASSTAVTNISGTNIKPQVTFQGATEITMSKAVVELKVFLEGPWNSATQRMDTTLKRLGILGQRFTGVDIAEQTVDSITVEIRNAATAGGSTTRLFKTAWLTADGFIHAVDDTEATYLEFDLPGGNYYAVVYHRNHLPIMTKTAAVFSSAAWAVYDFTLAQDKAYGTNPLKLLSPGVYGMPSGDANGDGLVSSADFALFNPMFSSGTTGYLAPDWNLDGTVTSLDFNIFNPNSTAAKQSQVP